MSTTTTAMITLTPTAAEHLKRLLPTPETALRIRVVGGGCSGMSYQMALDTPTPADQVIQQHGVTVVVDPKSTLYLKGSQVDYVESLTGAGFTVSNPNAKGSCGCGSSFAV